MALWSNELVAERFFAGTFLARDKPSSFYPPPRQRLAYPIHSLPTKGQVHKNVYGRFTNRSHYLERSFNPIHPIVSKSAHRLP